MSRPFFQEGDRVQYTRDYSRVWGIHGVLGTVAWIEKFGDRERVLVRVVWDGDNHESRVLGANLIIRTDLHTESC